MSWSVLFGGLAVLSILLNVWQWIVGRRFPLHQRTADKSYAPSVTVLKPLKGSDDFLESCLESWLQQEYTGEFEVLFGVDSESDPAVGIVRRLLEKHPTTRAALVVCRESLGANAKVSTLIQLQRQAKHELITVSDSDVRVPPDLIANAVSSLKEERVGIVSCFYSLANPSTSAMQWEAVAINADFWSQVLQSRSLRPLDFALGAVMMIRRSAIDQIGGFEAVADCLADDYQLGNRITKAGSRAELCPVVVECWDPPQGWGGVWKHQLRWARTIRACQPAPYFLSITNNATLWPLLWAVITLAPVVVGFALGMILLRIVLACDLQARLTKTRVRLSWLWMVPMKDLAQALVWAAAFTGNHVEWRGRRMRLRSDGTLLADNRSASGPAAACRH